MNILHLTQTDISTDSRILKEMTALASQEDYFVSGIGVAMDKRATPSSGRELLDIYSVSLWSRELRFLPKTFRHGMSVVELTTKMFFKSLRLKPSVIHCHDTLALPLGLLLKMCTSAHLIYDAHELESNKNGITKVSSLLTIFVEKAGWRFIDGFITVGDRIERWYKDKFGEKQSAVLLNSPVFEQNTQISENNYLRTAFSIPADKKIFIYVGLLGRGRGSELLLDTFKKSDIDSHLVFLGYGPLASEIKEVADEYENIHLHDAVAHDQVVAVAGSADVGLCLIQNVSLSDYYCLPNKLFEYCFAGIPILASNFPEISAVVNKYSLGKCCELDIDSVHQTVKEFESIGSFPKIDVDALGDLSWGSQQKKLIALYKNIAVFNKN